MVSNYESERGVLGAILDRPDTFFEIAPRIDWFTAAGHGEIFKAIEREMTNRGYLTLDAVRDALTNSGEAALAEITRIDPPLPASVPYYVEKLEDKRQAKALRQVIVESSERLKNGSLASDIADCLLEGVKALSNDDRANIRPFKETLKNVVDIIEERYKNRGAIPGIPTGIESLDDLIFGLQPERLYYIGGRPSEGKSAMLVQFASHAALQGYPVGFFSAESSAEEIGFRVLAQQTGIRQGNLMLGDLSAADFGRLQNGVGKFKDLPLYIDDTPNTHLDRVVRHARLMKAKYKIKALFVDYVQLIKHLDTRLKKHERVEEVSRRLKDLSRELAIPVVSAAQLGRDVDNRRPGLGDFQHSSALEQDADVAMLLYWQEAMDMFTQPVDLTIAKVRDGARGTVHLNFRPERVRFEEIQS